MLSEADAILVRNDPAIRGLALVLDRDAFIAAVQPHLGGREVHGLSGGYARYKPHMSCLVGWKLDLGDTSMFVHAKAFGGRQMEKFTRLGERPDHITFAIPDAATAVSFFPRDHRLRGLSRLREEAVRAELFPTSRALQTAEIQALNYKPERRYVGRCCGDGETAVVRIYTRDDYEGARQAFGAVKSGETYRVPKILAASDRARALAVEWLDGRSLADLLQEPLMPLDALAATATALAELHEQSGRNLLTTADEAAELLRLQIDMQTIAPHLSARLERAGRQLASRVAALAPQRSLIHGDFYADQVIIGTTVQLIDLDAARAGDPCSDVANFLAHLEVHGIENASDAFLAAYKTATRRQTIEKTLTLRTACSLFRLLPRPFRTRIQTWSEETGQILDRVERLLELKSVKPARPRDRVVVRDPLNAAADPAMPMIKTAIDPDVIGECLAALLASPQRCVVREIQVTRHKPGNRCVIEYTLDVDGTPTHLVGRIRAKDFHHRAWQVNNELWRNGFGAAAGVFVPEPVGAIKPLHLWLQKKVGGTAATAALPAPNWRDSARRVAAVAAAMHSSATALPYRHTVDDELTILSARFGMLAAAKPALADRLERILAACVSVGRTLDGAPMTVIHRDFYPDHLLFDGERTWLLDLDLATIGDPALDVGNFVAHLTEQSLRDFDDPNILADREEEIADDYCRAMPSATRDRIEAWAALSLARHVQLCTVVSGRAHLLPEMLDLAERRLAVTR